MVIQTPGSFVWAGSLAARLGVEGWSTWGVYLVTGCLQGCLLVIGVLFELRERKEGKRAGDGRTGSGESESDAARFNGGLDTDDEGHPVVENGLPQDESTPLLRKGSRP